MGGVGSKEKRVLLLGLDGSGKTSLLYQMSLGKHVPTIPTIGYNIEKVTMGDSDEKMLPQLMDVEEFTFMDVGGEERQRSVWHSYFKGLNFERPSLTSQE